MKIELRLRQRIEGFLNARWYGDAGALKFLAPLEWLYSLIADRRRDRALLKNQNQNQKRPTKSPAQVTNSSIATLVVGNLVAGGTGKTPVVAHIVSALVKQGARPGIVTRGYGGKATQWPRLVTAISDPRLCGDEAVELAQTTGVPVVASPDRNAAVRWLRDFLNCTVAVSDDGLQHYAMPRDLELVLVDGERKFGNGHRLPVGPLRESPERLRRADLVLITGRAAQERQAPQELALSHQEFAVELQTIVDDRVPVLTSSLVPASSRPLFRQSQASQFQLANATEATAIEEAPFVGQSCIAVCGIGAPARFHADLRDLGCAVQAATFADHENYDDLLRSGALEQWSKDHWIVTTAKDAVKLRFLLNRQAFASGEQVLDKKRSWLERVWVVERALVLASEDSSRLDRLLAKLESSA